MASVTSSVKHPIIRENLRRSWPVALVFFLLMFFTTTFTVLMSNGSRPQVRFNLTRMILSGGHPGILIFSAVFPLVAAMLMFRYLNTSGSVAVMHSLPFTRTKLFAEHFLSGLIIALTPFILTALTLLPFALSTDDSIIEASDLFGEAAVQAGTSGVGFLQWLAFLLSTLVCMFFIYAISVFAGIITGTSIIHFLVALGLNTAAILFFSLVNWYLTTFLIGYSTYENMLIEHVIVSSHPLVYFADSGPKHPLAIAVYFIIALVITGLALLLYKKRKLERTGDSAVFAGANYVILYIVTLLGMAFVSIPLYLEFGLATFFIGTFVGTVVSFLIVRMIMSKTMRVFNLSTLKVFAVSLLISAVFIACTVFDITGYDRRVPDPAHVQSAEFTFEQYGLSIPYQYQSVIGFREVTVKYDDPEGRALVTEAHRGVIETVLADSEIKHQLGMSDSDTLAVEPNINRLWRGNLSFDYDRGETFKMHREYSSVDCYNGYEKTIFKDIVESSEFKNALSIKNRIEQGECKGINLIRYSNENFENPHELLIPKEDRDALIVCLDKDFAALTFEDMNDDKDPLFALLMEFGLKEKAQDTETMPDGSVQPSEIKAVINIYYKVSSRYVNTIKWLKDKGLYDQVIHEYDGFSDESAAAEEYGEYDKD